MKLLNVTGKGFLSIGQETVTLDFKDSKGLTLIEGINLDEASKGQSNGSGKSALFIDLPYYLLFGSTLRETKYATEAIHNNNGECLVSGEFIGNDNKTYSIKRKRTESSASVDLVSLESKSDLRWSGKAAQEKIYQLTGLTPESYATTVCPGEDTERKIRAFPYLNSVERFELFCSLFPDLTLYDKARELAAKERLRLDKETEKLKLVLEANQILFTTLDEQLIDYKTKAKNWKDEQDERKQELDKQIKEEKEELKDYLINQEKQKTKYKNDIKNKQTELKKLEVKSASLQEQYSRLEKERDTWIKEKKEIAEVEMEKLKETLSEIAASIARMTQDEKLLSDNIKSYREEYITKETEIKTEIAIIKKTAEKRPKEGNCPLCSQPVTKEFLSSLRRKTLQEISALEKQLESKEIEEVKKKIANKEKEYDKLKNKLADAVIEQQKTKESISGLNEIIRTIDSDFPKAKEQMNVSKEFDEVINQVKSLKKDISYLERELSIHDENSNRQKRKAEEMITLLLQNKSSIDKEANPYNTEVQNTEKEIKEQTKKKKEIENKIKETELDLVKASWWAEKGFIKARAKAMKSLLDNFEITTQNYLARLTDRISVTYATERDTKAGSIKSSFEIIITDSNRTSSFGLWSSGERRRVQLAISLGLADLIYQAHGTATNLLFIDEPNDGLDSVGKDNVFEVLQERASKFDQSIFVIDHDSNFKERFDQTITVIMENGNSRLEL